MIHLCHDTISKDIRDANLWYDPEIKQVRARAIGIVVDVVGNIYGCLRGEEPKRLEPDSTFGRTCCLVSRRTSRYVTIILYSPSFMEPVL